jgi:hypothetical protein
VADAAVSVAAQVQRLAGDAEARYVDAWRARVADVEPIVNTGEVDITPDDIDVSVEQFYRQAEEERRRASTSRSTRTSDRSS